MSTVDPNSLRLLRFDHDPYERDSDEEDEYEGDIEPEPDEVLIRTVDIAIVDQNEKKLGNVRFWLIDREEIVEEVGDFVALLDDHSEEASDFAATLFNRRRQIKSKFAHEGTGVWGRELNADATVAYLQEIRVDKEVRSQGIGSWALREILRCNDLYLDGARFIYALPCALHSEWPRPSSWSDPDPYAAEKEAMSARVVRFYRRLGFRRVGTTAYFCCARSLSHLSHALPANADADEVESADPFAGMDPTMARAMTILSRQNLI